MILVEIIYFVRFGLNSFYAQNAFNEIPKNGWKTIIYFWFNKKINLILYDFHKNSFNNFVFFLFVFVFAFFLGEYKCYSDTINFLALITATLTKRLIRCKDANVRNSHYNSIGMEKSNGRANHTNMTNTNTHAQRDSSQRTANALDASSRRWKHTHTHTSPRPSVVRQHQRKVAATVESRFV